MFSRAILRIKTNWSRPPLPQYAHTVHPENAHEAALGAGDRDLQINQADEKTRPRRGEPEDLPQRKKSERLVHAIRLYTQASRELHSRAGLPSPGAASPGPQKDPLKDAGRKPLCRPPGNFCASPSS